MAEPEKATWVWDLSSVQNTDKILLFFQKQQVKDVYIQFDPSIPGQVYHSFINKLHKQHIRVHALDGAPAYTQEDLAAFLEQIRSFDWDGIHLDIEPYLSDEWETDQARAVHRYEQVIKQAAESGWLLGVDIPFWYDEIPASAGGTLAEFVVDRADYTVVMAYRDSAERIIEAARKELALGRDAGKEVIIAVETIKEAEAAGISFYGKSPAYFNREVNKIATECECQIAVHHAASWQSLVR
ncbi:hypothetical protein [Domibacillus indicus]|uniref:hypothetical protein n=1 Tax=Domibacillus indicus TaxID=1437523 RepID=UPI00061804C1|nr:hypothetical protein [Domibacillus indicus]